MKKTNKFLMFLIAIVTMLFIVPTFSNAATISVKDEESLNDAVSRANVGDIITLENNITVTKPIVIAKELTIMGNGYTVTGSSDWTSTSGNQTMFTAQASSAKLTLKNINLQNGPKYGVQSYDGATVILDDVSITGFKYGGVLANGGSVEVVNLHLGYNGTNSNNGIEIDKGSAATHNPSLVMNGVLVSDTTENVIRIAENGYLTEFTITNSSTTTNKVVIAGNTVALTDANDNIIAESTIPDKATANTDVKKVIVTLISNGETNKIAVDSGKTITQDFLKSHINIPENYQLDGFYIDAQYSNEFDFNNPLNSDTTIYTKISEITTVTPAPEIPAEPEKDETPKTGIQNYMGISLLVIILSTIAFIYTKKKDIKG